MHGLRREAEAIYSVWSAPALARSEKSRRWGEDASFGFRIEVITSFRQVATTFIAATVDNTQLPRQLFAWISNRYLDK